MWHCNARSSPGSPDGNSHHDIIIVDTTLIEFCSHYVSQGAFEFLNSGFVHTRTPTADSRTAPSFAPMSQAGNHDGVVDNMKKELEEHFDMGDWEFVGPQGSFTESVFKAKTWDSQEEVAIKVVSLRNPQLQDCK